MEQIADNSIVLLPDAGVNSQENADELAKRNIKCIEIDHHNTMVLNGVIQVNAHHSPNVTNKSGSGTLCTHKLSQYIDKQTNNKFSSQFIDIVALSIISDSCSVVSLENQCYVYWGLKNIKNPFLKYLCDNLIDGAINPHELSFKIIPLINSVQRSDDQELKEKIFKCFVGEYDNFEEVLKACQSAHTKQNKIVKSMVDELSPLVNPTKNIIIQFAEDIDGYTGLVAQRISSKFNKPTLILHEKSDEPSKYIGSVRSPYAIREILNNCDSVDWASGHDFAMGIQIDKDKLEGLEQYATEFDDVYEQVCYSYKANSIPKRLFAECDKLINYYAKGVNNPRFHIYNIRIKGNDIAELGRYKTTIKFTINGIDYTKQFCSKVWRAENHIGENKLLDIELIGTFGLYNNIPTVNIDKMEVNVVENDYLDWDYLDWSEIF